MEKEQNAQVNLLFSPKHHYKPNLHGKVDFSLLDFAAAIYKVDEKQMLEPSSQKAKADSTQDENKEPESTSEQDQKEPENSMSEDSKKEENEVCLKVTEQVATFTTDSSSTGTGESESRCHKSSQSSVTEATVTSSQTDSVEMKDTFAQAKKETADKPTVCQLITEATIPVQNGTLNREELIEFVKEQLPGLVDQYLEQCKRISLGVVGTSAQTDSATTASEEIQTEKESSESIEEDVNADQTQETVSEESINEETRPAVCSEIDAEPRQNNELTQYFYTVLFHENKSAEVRVIPGVEVQKRWFVYNSGNSKWPMNVQVHLENFTELFQVVRSKVPSLNVRQVESIGVEFVAPSTCGVYELRFVLKSPEENEDFTDNHPLVCTVNVIDDPFKFAEESNNVAENENNYTEKAPEVPQDEQEGEFDQDYDDDVTSTCDDETIYDSSDDCEQVEDFTFIPLPDCFDLNRVPALQSSFLHQKAESETSTAKQEYVNALGDLCKDNEEYSNVGSETGSIGDAENSEDDYVVHDDENANDTSLELTSINTVVLNEIHEDTERAVRPRSEEFREDDHDGSDQEDTEHPENATEANGSSDENDDLESSGDIPESPKGTIRVSASEERSLLDRLTKLGFGDREMNRQLLIKHEYNLQSVVKDLINSFEPLR